ncbi:kinase-interacting protein 1-like [Vigna unguiculata]|uniref:kinase-interacting protein 1-like n=1 Tax=Vigna unguiculata TaxID=3917 RepID=UPI001016DE50|nr:kinase-interacting protein 1-like [Vigna unguiculata]
MENVVAETLNIIHNEGESFTQRAEMYYRKRPQLIGYVEEVYRAYRALAQRYDHISKELQSANRTIATVFPEQVHYGIDEDDSEESFPGPKSSSSSSSSQDPINQIPKKGIPKPPDIPKDFRKQCPVRKIANSAKSPPISPTSGLTTAEALTAVDKLQKEILALQTEKEFVRISYEHSYEKYWKIEDKITEMQRRVCNFEDEFGINNIIEDNEARALMEATALNSCKETLLMLQEVKAQSSEEAKESYEIIKEAQGKLKILKDWFFSEDKSERDPKSTEEEDMFSMEKEMHECEVGEKLEKDSGSSLTLVEMADKIDDLVNKVVTLETAVSSQTGLVKRLVSEAEELQKITLMLEEDEEKLIEDTEETRKKLEEVEEKLRTAKILNQRVKMQENSLQRLFTRASFEHEHLSGKINNVKHDEEGENLLLHKNRSASDVELKEESEKPGDDNTETKKDLKTKKKKKDDYSVNLGYVRNEDNKDNLNKSIGLMIEKDLKTKKKKKDDYSVNLGYVRNEDNKDNLNKSIGLMIEKDLKTKKKKKDDYSVNLGYVRNEDNKYNLNKSIGLMIENIPELTPVNKDDFSESKSNVDTESLDKVTGEKDQTNWSQMFASGLDDREKILSEFNSVVKNYEDVKGKLNDAEKKNQDNILELALQIRELKDTVETKEKQINILQQKLTCSETNPEERPRITLPYYNYTSPLLGIAPHETEKQDTENPTSNTDAGAGAVSTSDADHHQQGVDKRTKFGILVKVTSNQHKRSRSLSILEKKFRSAINILLEENLEFWMRFSTSMHQTHKFQDSIEDLKCEVRSIRDDNMSNENSNIMQSEIKAIIKHLREIRSELLLWLEHSEILHEELQRRHPSLCTLQDEIARAATPNSASNMAELSGFQAAKFQGEVLNMKQENNKVRNQLQAGVVFVKGLKAQVDKMLKKLSIEIGVNNQEQITKQSTNRARIPLKSFLFGVKLRKQRQPVIEGESPTEQRQHSDQGIVDDHD